MKEQLTTPNFLDHLKDIADSPLAFVGYVLVVFFWGWYIWLNYKKSIINSFTTESKKVTVLEKLIGDKIPENTNPIDWLSLKLKEKIHRYFFFSFLSSLLTIIIIFAIATFKTTNKEPQKNEPTTVDTSKTIEPQPTVVNKVDSQTALITPPESDLWEMTGDKVIDIVLKKLNALEKKGKQNISQSELVSTLRPLFSRQAFQRGVREENWEYFLFALCRTRLIIEYYTSYFRDAEIRTNLDKVSKIMGGLQNDIEKIYGPAFSITEHIGNYINSSKVFIDNLPNRVQTLDYKFYDDRDKSIKQIRAILNPIGLSEK